MAMNHGHLQGHAVAEARESFLFRIVGVRFGFTLQFGPTPPGTAERGVQIQHQRAVRVLPLGSTRFNRHDRVTDAQTAPTKIAELANTPYRLRRTTGNRFLGAGPDARGRRFVNLGRHRRRPPLGRMWLARIHHVALQTLKNH